MNDDLLNNIACIHITELGIMRIKRNLGLNIEDMDTVSWCKEKIANSKEISRKGKNRYVYVDSIIITVNAHRFTVITAHREKSASARK